MNEENKEKPPLPAASTALDPISAPLSLSELFAEYHERAFRAAFRVTGRAEDAEDALQTVFLRMLRRDKELDPGEFPGAYLCRAAVNAALDILRSRKRAKAVPIDDAVGEVITSRIDSPERAPEDREIRDAVREGLAKVSPRAAEIFALRYFEGYGNLEISQMLELSQTAVAVTLHRTRGRLREEIGSMLGE